MRAYMYLHICMVSGFLSQESCFVATLVLDSLSSASIAHEIVDVSRTPLAYFQRKQDWLEFVVSLHYSFLISVICILSDIFWVKYIEY